MWHGYIGLENLNLNAAQRTQLYDEIRQLGPSFNPSPAKLLHERLRLDGDAGIWEALFNENKLTVQAIKAWLANIFGIQPDDITVTTVTQSFANGETSVTTYSYGATNYVRSAPFNGLGCEWCTSGDECRGYFSLYQSEWEGET